MGKGGDAVAATTGVVPDYPSPTSQALYHRPMKATAEYYTHLNAKVASMTQQKVDAARGVGKGEVAPEAQYVIAADGAYVYVNRWLGGPLLAVALAAFLIAQAPSLTALALLVPVMYLWYDLYSGVLHVCLDDVRNLGGWKSVVLFQAAYEFQWHHSIPRDICIKSYLGCCADLNVIVAASIALNVPHLLAGGGTMAALMGLKLGFAYFGQHCHRQAHNAHASRPAYVRLMQRAGLMLTQTKHNLHHRTHDQNFCLLGYADPVINWGLKNVTKNDTVWFSLWLVMTAVDLWLLNQVATTFFPSVFAGGEGVLAATVSSGLATARNLLA